MKMREEVRILRIKRLQEMNAAKITLQSPEQFNLQPGQYVEISSLDDNSTVIPLAAIPKKSNPHAFKVCVAAPTKIIDDKHRFKWTLFHDIQEGATLGLQGPFGRPLPMNIIEHQPLLLIAAGSGLASMRSIFARIIKHESTQLLYSAKICKDLHFLSNIMKFKENPKNFITLTQEKSKDFHHGRLNAHLEHMLIDKATNIFICGPESFMQDMVKILLNKNTALDKIYVILNKIIPKKEAMCPVFRLDELDEDEFLGKDFAVTRSV
jgi:NAD(P)H-flavin reductase